MSVSLTDEQNKLYRHIVNWAKTNVGDYAREAFNGYAGTGKTTLLGAVAHELVSIAFASKKQIAFCAPTGKASRVLGAKIQALGMPAGSYTCGTMHSLFYTRMDCVQAVDSSMFLKKDVDYIYQKYCLIVIDEASMLSQDTYNDLEEFEVPILFVGDPGQLPPVNGKTMDLLRTTKNTLLTVHRQALDNPIIRLATQARFKKPLTRGALFGPNGSKTYVGPLRDKVVGNAKNAWMVGADKSNSIVLTGGNVNRTVLNRRTRETLKAEGGIPTPGERVVCLLNEKASGVVNGQLFKVLSAAQESDNFYKMRILQEDLPEGAKPEEFTKRVLVYKDVLLNPTKQKIMHQISQDFFMQDEFHYTLSNNSDVLNERILFFDYGYCLTVHKSQGSEWPDVFFCNDELYGSDADNYARWLYTAITRARNCLVIETMS